SLVFTFLPKIFLSLQGLIGYVGASIFASAFFLLVFFAAITSQVSILQVPISAFQDELKYSRFKSVIALGLCSALLVIACMVSFGLVPFFKDFVVYAGETKSFFDVVVDVFYETILPLNGFVICLFVTYRWRKSNLDKELMIGDEGYDGSFTQRYVNFALSTFVPAILLFVFVSTVLLKFFGISVI
ncbi:MAG: hypothetical protein JKX81_06610, partial [Arenicella sp.]|nr:hypothetical protein [Arenicella sp.]